MTMYRSTTIVIYCLRSVHVINVRDAYEIFYAIEYINVQKIQNIPN
jgi:hypothetical protein